MQRLGFIGFSSQLVLCIQAPANVWESRRDSDGIPKIFHNHAKGESCNMEATMNPALCFLFLWNAASFHMLKGGGRALDPDDGFVLETSLPHLRGTEMPIKKGQIWVEMSDSFYGWK